VVSQGRSHFPRNLARDFGQYTGERPELTTSITRSQRRPNKKGNNRIMKTTLIKRIVSSLLFACGLVGLVAAMALGTSDVAQADNRVQTSCSAQTLRGSYLFATHGYNIINGVAVPKAILEGIDFNGDGTLVAAFVTVSINGTIIRASGTLGTYTVQADCRGTLTFADGNNFDTFVEPTGKQLWMIQTVAGIPPGATAVFEGMATRVSPAASSAANQTH
jgi:hypothetical protein